MASFELQIEALTSLAIDGSSTPTQNELTQFLRDGVNEVTDRLIQSNPSIVEAFLVETSTQSSQEYDRSGARIVSVIREANADGDTDGSTAWRDCRKVPQSLRSKLTDKDSLHYASIYNPAFILGHNGKVSVYPKPDGINDGFRVIYINNVPKGDSFNDLTYAHSTLGYFPQDKVYLVVIYAAIKAIEAKIASYAVDEEDMELVQGYQSNLIALKSQYMVGIGAVPSGEK